ncbi:GNAT family N-acetyltransferase [Clostridium botulinum]|uniref:Acyltransferase n=2 Tax=Clostridium botulinum TaxID=1491 RepID=A5I3K3_CLOBH|nr:N-acetyltransferase [Clostridium botulinum]EKN42517.1 acetyltransferase [Clostridium botulinum CFSAN001627]ABS35546.1 acetyltransferase, GNAT family [Clostridium botulinum A str. ATCC 19397]ABS36404.1 acetyltransferase, GNAT family [Clostridium botulinum A str. Hall]AWB17946.1 GNAT family N-acetyltransferase [Clostridium botulinum]AWB30727.1 GNAT family N-acetyltransferase [Clostridium botulinum]
MNIRTATIEDLEAITAVEAICFPPEEAASESDFKKRLSMYPNHFWLLEDDGKLVGFVNGMVTNESKLSDEMFEDANLHNENGQWQMIFGVNTIPEYRGQGCAEKIINKVIADARAQWRTGLVLTCKEKLLHYYAKFGFKNEGISESTHGGAVWYDMRLTF